MIQFRDYQAHDVKRITALFTSGTRRVLYALPVGGGKTFVACGVMLGVTGRVLVVAHRIELLRQMRRSMEAAGVDPERVTLMSPRRAQRLSVEQLALFSLVIVDEAHRAGAPEYRAVLDRVPSAFVLGLSASPYRREGLRAVFDELVEGPGVEELVEAGHIVAPRCWSIPEEQEGQLAEDLRAVEITAGDYNVRQLSEVMNRPHLVGDIVREWSEHAAGRSTLVFATSVDHARSITEAFCGAGVDARFVHGGTTPGERERIIAAFDAGAFPVLVSVLLMTEGIDVHRIDCVVIARPTRSIVLYLQALGRGMRPSPTGLTPIVLDHAGAVRWHGLPTMARRWSLDPAPRGPKGTPREMSKRCAACGTMAHLSAVACAYCGIFFRCVEPETRLEEVKRRVCIAPGCGMTIARHGNAKRCKLHAQHVCSQEGCAKPITRSTKTGRCRLHAQQYSDAGKKGGDAFRRWFESLDNDQKQAWKDRSRQCALAQQSALTKEERNARGQRAAKTKWQRERAAYFASKTNTHVGDNARQPEDMEITDKKVRFPPPVIIPDVAAYLP